MSLPPSATRRGCATARAWKSIGDIAVALAQEHTLERVAVVITDHAQQVVHSNHVMLWVRDPGPPDELHLLVSSGMPAALATLTRTLPLDAPSIAATAARTGQPIEIADYNHVGDEFALSREYARLSQQGSAFAQPLIAHGCVLGVLIVTWPRPHHLTNDQQVKIGVFADLSAIAIENTRLRHEALERSLRAEPASAGLTTLNERLRAANLREQQLVRQAEQARHETTAILNRITDAFFALDHDWNFVYVNQKGGEVLERLPSDLVGKNVWEQFPEAVGSTFDREYRRAMRDQVPVQFEEYYSPLHRWFDVHAYPSPEGLSVFFEDVTERRHYIDEIRASQERLARIVETIVDGIIIVDRNGIITLANPAAAAIVDIPIEQMVGTSYDAPIWQITNDEGTPIPASRLRFSEVMRTGKPLYGQELTIRRPDGTRRVLSINANVLRDPNGAIIGMVASLRDITRRIEDERERERLVRQLQSEGNWLRSVIERSPVGIVLAEDAPGTRIIANRQAEELFGHPFEPEKGLTQYVGQLYHPDGRLYTRQELAATRALQGETVTAHEELLRQPSGRFVPILVSAGPIRDIEGRVAGAVVIFADISLIKELERLREEWNSVIAHDLRQPVTIISGYAGLLERELKRHPHTESEAKAVEHIVTSARNLNKMIGDLLDVSRIVARRLRLERRQTNLPDLVCAVVERLGAVTAGHPVRIELPKSLPPVSCDPARVEQVLGNLLSNAAKYGFPGTEIVVTVRRRAHEVEISVTNRGTGIPPEELPKLFTRFHRAAGGPAQAAGLGLGLYISKGLVEAHGGHIRVTSTPGQETVVSFTLPYLEAPA